MRDSCGSCGTGETPQTQSVEEAHRAHPTESEQPGAQINHLKLITKQKSLRKQPKKKRLQANSISISLSTV